ncbi:hypothetical protein [Elstera litoralis]|uniref:hypothetical protein n=1 Tax=Elstera litoralis TaxID=552518 RepID=UPI002FC29C0A
MSLPILAATVALAALLSLVVLAQGGSGILLWPLTLLTGAAAWALLARLSNDTRAEARFGWVVPALFGLTLLYLWEVIVRGFGVPKSAAARAERYRSGAGGTSFGALRRFSADRAEIGDCRVSAGERLGLHHRPAG